MKRTIFMLVFCTVFLLATASVAARSGVIWPDYALVGLFCVLTLYWATRLWLLR